jgi:hypothetical protein
MYASEMPRIRDGMLADPETFARGIMFAVCSIRQSVERVPALLRDIDANGERAEALAMAMKLDAYLYLQAHATALWRDVRHMETRDALVRLLAVPSLGIVKSAFVLQFLGHNIGCMDTRNLRREGIDYRAFRVDGNGKLGRPPVSSRRIDLYFTIAGGRAEELWDTWCNEVAEDRWRENTRNLTAQEVSDLHLEVIS